MAYRIKNFVRILSDGSLAISGDLMRDGQNAPQSRIKEILQHYFDNSYSAFLDYLQRFKNLPSAPEEIEERELKLLLETLIEAKKRLYKE